MFKLKQIPTRLPIITRPVLASVAGKLKLENLHIIVYLFSCPCENSAHTPTTTDRPLCALHMNANGCPALSGCQLFVMFVAIKIPAFNFLAPAFHILWVGTPAVYKFHLGAVSHDVKQAKFNLSLQQDEAGFCVYTLLRICITSHMQMNVLLESQVDSFICAQFRKLWLFGNPLQVWWASGVSFDLFSCWCGGDLRATGKSVGVYTIVGASWCQVCSATPSVEVLIRFDFRLGNLNLIWQIYLLQVCLVDNMGRIFR